MRSCSARGSATVGMMDWSQEGGPTLTDLLDCFCRLIIWVPVPTHELMCNSLSSRRPFGQCLVLAPEFALSSVTRSLPPSRLPAFSRLGSPEPLIESHFQPSSPVSPRPQGFQKNALSDGAVGAS